MANGNADNFSLVGYSERGMVNALCDDIAHAKNRRVAVGKFLSWFVFPGQPNPDFTGIVGAKLLVEQSFSDFGDPDLLILLEHNGEKKQAVIIEAKVSTDTNSWETVGERWNRFLRFAHGGEGSTSNLFVQLHRKVRLVELLCRGREYFETDRSTPRGSLGRNCVVNKAADHLEQYVTEGDVWYGAILPDDRASLSSFIEKEFQESCSIEEPSFKWNFSRTGFLSWQDILHHMQEDEQTPSWPRTRSAFVWNKGQVYRAGAAAERERSRRDVVSYEGKPAYVVGPGQQCRIAPVETRAGFFWRTTKVSEELLPLWYGETPEGMVPVLPEKGSVYEWDPPNGPNRLPAGQEVDELSPKTPLRVIRPSWLTTRVEIADAPQGSPRFLVYTHHLRRQPLDL